MLALRRSNFEFRGELRRGPAHREAFRRARALVMPTRIPEALGRTVLESLSKGTPVIASARGALPELLDERTGVASDDLAVLEAALDTPFDRKACFSRAQQFHVSRELDAMLAASERLLAGRSLATA